MQMIDASIAVEKIKEARKREEKEVHARDFWKDWLKAWLKDLDCTLNSENYYKSALSKGCYESALKEIENPRDALFSYRIDNPLPINYNLSYESTTDKSVWATAKDATKKELEEQKIRLMQAMAEIPNAYVSLNYTMNGDCE